MTSSSAEVVEGVAEAAAVVGALAAVEAAECRAEAGGRKGEAPDRRAVAADSPRRPMPPMRGDLVVAAERVLRGRAAPDRKAT